MIFRHLITAAMMFASAATLQAQVHRMTVTLANGDRQEFLTENLDDVTFSTTAIPANTLIVDNVEQPIGSVLEWHVGDGIRYYLYADSHVTSPDASAPLLTFWVSDTFTGEASLTPADMPQAQLDMEGICMGNLKVQHGKTGLTTLSLYAAGGPHFVCGLWTGTATEGYASNCRYSVESNGTAVASGTMNTLFRYNTPTGGACHFAMGTADVSLPSEYPAAGGYGVKVEMAASLVGKGTLSLEENSENIRIIIYDYAESRTLYSDEFTHGTIETRTTATGTLFRLDATVTAGLHLLFDFFGPTTATDDEALQQMTPPERETSNILVFEADGITTSHDMPIVVAKMKDETNGNHHFYFLTDEENSLTDKFLTPQMIFSPSMENAGQIDLSALEPNTWKFDFSGIQLYSPDNEYMPSPNNGILTVNHNNETGEYEIRLEVKDLYPSTWGSGTAGTGKTVKLYYKGIPATL